MIGVLREAPVEPLDRLGHSAFDQQYLGTLRVRTQVVRELGDHAVQEEPGLFGAAFGCQDARGHLQSVRRGRLHGAALKPVLGFFLGGLATSSQQHRCKRGGCQKFHAAGRQFHGVHCFPCIVLPPPCGFSFSPIGLGNGMLRMSLRMTNASAVASPAPPAFRSTSSMRSD